MAAPSETIARERRQLSLMVDRLERLEDGELTIGVVISDLEGLLSELELADGEWRHRFLDAWTDLEIPYAVALDRQEPIPTVADETVAAAVARLRSLVRQQLSSLPSEEP